MPAPKFILSGRRSYPWDVTGTLAGHAYAFGAQFAYLEQRRIDELVAASSRREALLKIGEDDPELSWCNNRAIAAEVMVGWDERVVDDDGERIEFNAANLEQMLETQGVAHAIVSAWNRSLESQPRSTEAAKRGNSKAPRGIG